MLCRGEAPREALGLHLITIKPRCPCGGLHGKLSLEPSGSQVLAGLPSDLWLEDGLSLFTVSWAGGSIKKNQLVKPYFYYRKF